LIDQPNVSASKYGRVVGIQFIYILAADKNTARIRVINTGDTVKQGRFA
jgi:hypothetical protein